MGLIVEGHGEVKAAPVLLRRIIYELWPSAKFDLLGPPDRKKRNQMVRQRDLERAVEAMARRVGENGAVLIILDGDDDPACELGPRLQEWASAARPDRKIGVVIAEREWEAWYLEAVESIRGQRGLEDTAARPARPERIRDPKGWLDKRMASGYSETLDQAAFAAGLDVDATRRSYSFDKLVRETGRLLGEVVPPRSSGA